MNVLQKSYLFLGAIAISLTPMNAQAQANRFIVLNGVRLNPYQISQMDQANCTYVPNGRYWFNPYTNQWGYEGNPIPQGYVGQACGRRQAPRRKSLSERGLLYSPGEILNR